MALPLHYGLFFKRYFRITTLNQVLIQLSFLLLLLFTAWLCFTIMEPSTMLHMCTYFIYKYFIYYASVSMPTYLHIV